MWLELYISVLKLIKRINHLFSNYTSTKNNVIMNDDGSDNEGNNEMQELDRFEGYANRVQMQKLKLDIYLEESCLD